MDGVCFFLLTAGYGGDYSLIAVPGYVMTRTEGLYQVPTDEGHLPESITFGCLAGALAWLKIQGGVCLVGPALPEDPTVCAELPEEAQDEDGE